MSDDERAIRDVVATWFTASKAGDTATVLDLMTDDVVFLVAGRRPFGKAMFAAAADAMKNVELDGTMTIEELHIAGRVAYLRGRFALTITPPGAPGPVKHDGYTLTILRKGDDGRWRIARDANLPSTKS